MQNVETSCCYSSHGSSLISTEVTDGASSLGLDEGSLAYKQLKLIDVAMAGEDAQAPRAASPAAAMPVEPPPPGFEETQVEEDRCCAMIQSLVS